MAPGAIDVWWCDLATLAADEAALQAKLTPGEAVEVARFHRPEDRRQRAAARLFLRGILGQVYLGRPPVEVRWVRDASGRPQFERAEPAVGDFNLSHSGTHLLLAVAGTGRIGADVEVSYSLEVDSMAKVCMTAAERRWLGEDSTVGEKEQRFFRLWTMKEAVLKCLGLGLGCDPRRCEMTVATGRAVLRTPADEIKHYTVVELPIGLENGVAAAIAWEGHEPRIVRLWRAETNWVEAM